MTDPATAYISGELMALKIAVRILVQSSPDKANILALIDERLEQSIARISETAMPDETIAGLRAAMDVVRAPPGSRS